MEKECSSCNRKEQIQTLLVKSNNFYCIICANKISEIDEFADMMAKPINKIKIEKKIIKIEMKNTVPCRKCLNPVSGRNCDKCGELSFLYAKRSKAKH
jgi:hypothetical protein